MLYKYCLFVVINVKKIFFKSLCKMFQKFVFGFFFKLILLLFLATGSYLAYLSTNQIEIETSLESSERIYSLKNAEFFGSDTQGELTYKIFSKKAKTESGDDQIILEHVNLEYYSDELNDWKISSEKGAMYDDANLLVLTGNVLIENQSTIRPSLWNIVVQIPPVFFSKSFS